MRACVRACVLMSGRTIESEGAKERISIESRDDAKRVKSADEREREREERVVVVGVIEGRSQSVCMKEARRDCCCCGERESE